MNFTRILHNLLWMIRKMLLVAVLPLPLLLHADPAGVNVAEVRARYLAEMEETRLRLVAFVDHKNPRKSAREREELVQTILRESSRLYIPDYFHVDARPVNPAFFLTALINVESSFYRDAVSHADARGYMQLMPATVAWMDDTLRVGEPTATGRLFETRTNVARGVTYLNFLIDELDDLRMVCLAYNAGPGAVSRGFWVERYWLKIHAAYREIQEGSFQAKSVTLL